MHVHACTLARTHTRWNGDLPRVCCQQSSNTHWHLACINFKEKRTEVYDSLGSNHPEVCVRVCVCCVCVAPTRAYTLHKHWSRLQVQTYPCAYSDVATPTVVTARYGCWLATCFFCVLIGFGTVSHSLVCHVHMNLCVCERERESVCVCVCVCTRTLA